MEIDSSKVPSPENSCHNFVPRKAEKKVRNGCEYSQRCMARVCNDWQGGQCKRVACSQELCKQHYNIYIKNGYLKFGRIDEPRVNKHKNPYNRKEVWKIEPEEECNLITFD